MNKPMYLGEDEEPGYHLIRCECGAVGRVDDEQYRGEISIDCPSCDYHQTVDLRDDTS